MLHAAVIGDIFPLCICFLQGRRLVPVFEGSRALLGFCLRLSAMEIQPRANKNRPAQQSTKRAVSTLRVAPGLSASAGADKSGRDPRFDAVSKGAVGDSRILRGGASGA